jgi:enoyl-CoA hydratase/carnithine racemase
MFEALVAATERLAHEKGVRVVVLSGEGRAFCAGLDPILGFGDAKYQGSTAPAY